MSLALELRQTYLHEQPLPAARTLAGLDDKQLNEELEDMGASHLVPVLELMPDSSAARVFDSLDAPRQSGVLAGASPRLALLLLDAMDDDAREILMAQLPDLVREDLERLSRFEENSAGRLMDRPMDAIHADMTVAETLELVRHSDIKRARSFYVVDDANRLAGKVHMQDLALAEPEQTLQALLRELEGVVTLTARRPEIVEQLERFRVDSIPVVDLEGRLMGVVRYQRLFEAVESVASADIQTMVGASADERALSTPLFSVKRRLPWLHINLLTAFLAAAVVGLFEGLIAQFTALAVLLPVVAGQSGNAGSQALAVTMRGLALKEIGAREWKRVLHKEIWVGTIDGLALAVTCGAGVYLWSQSLGLALVIGVAMILSMIAAGISGALVPIVLTRLGQDPATASSIILTTVTDVAGFFSFLGTATFLSFML
jgi:magnesium transporter